MVVFELATVTIQSTTVGIKITTVGFPPCLPSLQTRIHKGGGLRPPLHTEGGLRPPAPLRIPLWMGVWRLDWQGGNPTVVI